MNVKWKTLLCACWLACGCETHELGQDGESVKATPLPQRTETAVPTPIVAPSSGGTSSEPETDSQACSRLPFFDFYRTARLITLDEPNTVRLQIHINYHTGAGCMAPDGYGTDLIMTLGLRAEGSACFIDRAEVRAVDWGLSAMLLQEIPDERKLRFDFTPFEVLQRLDLTSSDTTAVSIHNPDHAVSALIRRTGVLWYEQTRPDSALHTVVDTQGEESGCCWPATSTNYREYDVYD